MPQKPLKISKYSDTIRGPKLWNYFLNKNIKAINCVIIDCTVFLDSGWFLRVQLIFVLLLQ